MHLASALLVRAASREQGGGKDVLFLGFDTDLMGAVAEVMSAGEPGEAPRDGG